MMLKTIPRKSVHVAAVREIEWLLKKVHRLIFSKTKELQWVPIVLSSETKSQGFKILLVYNPRWKVESYGSWLDYL